MRGAWILVAAALAAPAASPEPVRQPGDPESCAGCHARQVTEWRGSAHAGAAASEGFLASLRRYGAPPATVADRCLGCHVPGAAERTVVAARLLAGVPAEGVTCVACHGGTPAAHPSRVRAGVPVEAAEACAGCHRWSPGGVACSTVFEGWRGSPAAAAALSCQGCHMRDGSHRVEGSRSREMLARAVSLRLQAEASAKGPVALVEVRNLAGHRLPDG